MSDLGGGYNGNASLKRLGVEISYTEEQVAEIVKCSEDPIYFIRNYVKIVNNLGFIRDTYVGNLIIKFTITFPKTISQTNKAMLENLL